MRCITGKRQWIGSLAMVIAVLVGWPLSVYAQQPTDAIDRALAYIRTQQQPDGSFAGLGPASTADAVYALAAADQNVAEVAQGGKSAIDFLRSQAATAGSDTGVAAKFLIAMLLAGQTPIQPDGTDLIAEVQEGYNAQTGQYGKDVTAHAYALVALTAAGAPIQPEAIAALTGLQNEDGGWSFDGTPASGSDTNTTALVVQALVAVGDQSEAVSSAIEYLRTQQNDDGGFPYSQTSQFGNASDANSTALSIQALLAAGEDLANWAKNGATPADRLVAFQNESGAFRYQDSTPEDNQFATYQAVPALAGDTLPLEGVAVALPAPSASAAPSAVATTQPVAGGPTTLPNTGAPSYDLPLIGLAVLLVLAGVMLLRRRAY